jgi:hypothetical protein
LNFGSHGMVDDHENRKDPTCSKCGSNFTTKFNLKRHVSIIDTVVKIHMNIPGTGYITKRICHFVVLKNYIIQN